MEGCYDRSGAFIAEPQRYDAQSACNDLFPSHASPYLVAGMPLSNDVVKCQLKPVDAKDYPSFTPVELQRLKTIFPGGVCDFSKPGVGQTRVVPWASFGPAPQNLIFDLRRHKTSN